jgi:hypothetical protein
MQTNLDMLVLSILNLIKLKSTLFLWISLFIFGTNGADLNI